jgi:uncharacterized protein (TIGR02453 family)
VLTFKGISSRALSFYAELEDNNNRQFWLEHKAEYESEVRDPMLALVSGLDPDFGAVKLFRPYRDTRFSADKSPYKTHQAAFAGISPGVGYYVRIDSGGLLAGGGFRAHSTAQVERYREAVDDDASGSELSAVVAALRAEGFTFEGEQLKTRPRGYDADHPRLDLLRYKSLMAVMTFGTPAWLATDRAQDEVNDVWRAVAPLTAWVVDHVGHA